MDQPHPRPAWTDIGFFALAYWIFAEAGHGLSLDGSHREFAPFWPSSGLYFAALLHFAPSRHPRIVLGALVASLISNVVLHGQSVPASLGYWTATTLEALCASRAVGWWRRGPVRMSRLADVLRLIAAGIFASALVGAPIGAVTRSFAQGGSPIDDWRIWWAADTLGILLIAPVLLSWTAADASPLRQIAARRGAEFALLLTGLAGALAFAVHSGADSGISRRFVVLPLLIWTALRFGPRGSSIVLLLLAVQASAYTAHGLGSIGSSGAPVGRQVVDLQLLLCVLVASFLIVTAFTAERAATNRDLERKQSLLEAIHRAQTEFIGETPLPAVFRSLLAGLMKLTASDAGFIGEVLTGDDGPPRLRTHTITSLVRTGDGQDFTERRVPEDHVSPRAARARG